MRRMFHRIVPMTILMMVSWFIGCQSTGNRTGAPRPSQGVSKEALAAKLSEHDECQGLDPRTIDDFHSRLDQCNTQTGNGSFAGAFVSEDSTTQFSLGGVKGLGELIGACFKKVCDWFKKSPEPKSPDLLSGPSVIPGSAGPSVKSPTSGSGSTSPDTLPGGSSGTPSGRPDMQGGSNPGAPRIPAPRPSGPELSLPPGQGGPLDDWLLQNEITERFDNGNLKLDPDKQNAADHLPEKDRKYCEFPVGCDEDKGNDVSCGRFIPGENRPGNPTMCELNARQLLRCATEVSRKLASGQCTHYRTDSGGSLWYGQIYWMLGLTYQACMACLESFGMDDG